MTVLPLGTAVATAPAGGKTAHADDTPDDAFGAVLALLAAAQAGVVPVAAPGQPAAPAQEKPAAAVGAATGAVPAAALPTPAMGLAPATPAAPAQATPAAVPGTPTAPSAPAAQATPAAVPTAPAAPAALSAPSAPASTPAAVAAPVAQAVPAPQAVPAAPGAPAAAQPQTPVPAPVQAPVKAPAKPAATDAAPATATPVVAAPAPAVQSTAGKRPAPRDNGDGAQPDAQAPATTAVPTPAPAQAAQPVDAPAQAAPSAPPTPAAQLAERLAPLHKGPDGVHRLTIHLNPVDLGPISVTAEVRGGDIAVQLAGGTDAGRDALRNALPDLRRHLEDAGFGSCSLDLGQQHAPNQGQPQAQARQSTFGGRDTGSGEPDRTATPRPAAPAGRTGTDRSLDLHV